MVSGPLTVAGVAAALLVVTIGIDATMTTTYALDVWTGSAWRELARMPYTYDDRSIAPFGQATIAANESDDVHFRVRVENGYFWASAHDYTARHLSETVAEGTVEALARSQASGEFTVPAKRFYEAGGGGREPVPPTDPPVLTYADLSVDVEDVRLYASFSLREVSA